MGDMKIELLSNSKPVKKWPYKLVHKYKYISKKEIDNMLDIGIIYPVDKSEWASPMVMQPKNNDPKKLFICVYFHWINQAMLTDSFPTHFVDEIIKEVVGHECYLTYFQGTTKFQQQRRTNIKQHLFVSLFIFLQCYAIWFK